MPSDEDIDEEMRRRSRFEKYCNPVPRYHWEQSLHISKRRTRHLQKESRDNRVRSLEKPVGG